MIDAMDAQSQTTLPRKTKLIALRLDDVGASSKKYEVYSNKFIKFGKFRFSANWLFLKYLAPWKAWGPYREIQPKEWLHIYDFLEQNHARLTVAVTATWAESESNLIPFPKRFPEVAKILKEGLKYGLLEIANHGLTHCQISGNVFRPKLFEGNRKFHREFGEDVDVQTQEMHLRQSQAILQDWFEVNIVTFVPPGNLFTPTTLQLARKYGIRFVSCNSEPQTHDDLVVLGNRNVYAFHDRDIVIAGTNWLNKKIIGYEGAEFCFVKELVNRGLVTDGN